MRSVKVELLRFGSDAGVIQDRYLVAVDGVPARKVEPSGDGPDVQADILRALNELRYREGGGDPGEALEKLTSFVGQFLEDLPEIDGPVQIDIVTDKVELWALPFELAQDKNGRYLIGDKDRPVVLTRRVRRSSFAESTPDWPMKPRILFAWAGDVMAKEHRRALHVALEPWIGPLEENLIPDPRPVLTERKNATLSDIAEECQDAADKEKPYTHVHILAHGAELPGQPQLVSFGVALEEGTVTAEQLARAVRAGESDGPTVATLAICDSSHAANTLLSGGRVAYELHKRGVPVVIGSQFPLTEKGAVIYASQFYKDLFAKDVRIALRDARVALRDADIEGHDWASVTAHLQLPEGYSDLVRDSALKIELAQLNTVSKWAQGIVEDDRETSPKGAARIEELLGKRIDSLRSRTDTITSEVALLENLGLLASAHKRLAELVLKNGAPDAESRSRAILEEAGKWYLDAHDRALSHHWSGTQHLAITAATTGGIPPERTVHWRAALHAASREASTDIAWDDGKRETVIWALGSVAELQLLAQVMPDPEPEGSAKARDAIQQLIDLAEQKPAKIYAINSTWRQFRRYVHWWTRDHGFFEQRGRDLSEEAAELVAVLEPHVQK